VPYKPKPIDTGKEVLPRELCELTELLAQNTHDLWAKRRMAEGWVHGDHRDDVRKRHPNLVPYAELPNSEKEYDRTTAMEALKVIMALNYSIKKKASVRGKRRKGAP
jgi:hypothetical protein